MANPAVGLLFLGLIIRTVIAVVVVAAVIWLILKIGKLADAYREKLKAK